MQGQLSSPRSESAPPGEESRAEPTVGKQSWSTFDTNNSLYDCKERVDYSMQDRGFGLYFCFVLVLFSLSLLTSICGGSSLKLGRYTLLFSDYLVFPMDNCGSQARWGRFQQMILVS